jgi:hypothetical protein
MKIFAALFASIAITLLSQGSSQAEDFGYTTNNGTVTITQYQGPGGAVVIPSSINQLPVVAIANYAFFYSGLHVTNIALPSTLTGIGEGGFDGCPNLATISVDTASTAFESVDGVLFSKDQTALVAFPNGRAGTYSIPDGVTTPSLTDRSISAMCSGLTIPDGSTALVHRERRVGWVGRGSRRALIKSFRRSACSSKTTDLKNWLGLGGSLASPTCPYRPFASRFCFKSSAVT